MWPAIKLGRSNRRRVALGVGGSGLESSVNAKGPGRVTCALNVATPPNKSFGASRFLASAQPYQPNWILNVSNSTSQSGEREFYQIVGTCGR